MRYYLVYFNTHRRWRDKKSSINSYQVFGDDESAIRALLRGENNTKYEERLIIREQTNLNVDGCSSIYESGIKEGDIEVSKIVISSDYNILHEEWGSGPLWKDLSDLVIREGRNIKLVELLSDTQK